MKLNKQKKNALRKTHEGGIAPYINAGQQLRRSVLSCLLWENEFYEDGVEISKRITWLAAQVAPEELAELAIEARHEMNLRHVPLLLLASLATSGSGTPKLVANTIVKVIRRADEMTEFLAIYWKDGKRPLTAQMKKGLSRVFGQFDAYQLAKYDRAGVVKLRDVLFLVHAKPRDKEQETTWKQLVDETLSAPDTWEVGLSAGKSKKETFTRLLSEGKLGYMALLRNLRNMSEAGVDAKLVNNAILARKGADRVLPFRFVAAERAAPRYHYALDKALKQAIGKQLRLPGRTIVLVDVSGSMLWSRVSERSDLTRMDAAAALASLVNGEDLRVFTFSEKVVEVPARRGLSGVDAVNKSQPNGGTYLGKAVKQINRLPHDRLIVITDEQSADTVPNPVAKHAYMINVASNKNGVGYKKWLHLDGFSESVLRFIAEVEGT